MASKTGRASSKAPAVTVVAGADSDIAIAALRAHLMFLCEMEEMCVVNYVNAVHSHELAMAKHLRGVEAEAFYREFMHLDAWLREAILGKPGETLKTMISTMMVERGFPGVRPDGACKASIWYMNGEKEGDCPSITCEYDEDMGKACVVMICFPSPHPYPRLTITEDGEGVELTEVSESDSDHSGEERHEGKKHSVIVDNRVFTPIFFRSESTWTWDRPRAGKWRFMIVSMPRGGGRERREEEEDD